MSYEVYRKHKERLSIVIVDPSSLAVSFHCDGIISMDEEEAITNKANTLSARDRTISLLAAVGRQLVAHPHKMGTIIQVFSRHFPTKDISEEMSRDYESYKEQQTLSVGNTSPQPAETPSSSAMTPTQLQARSGLPPFPSGQPPQVQAGAVSMGLAAAGLPVPGTVAPVALTSGEGRSQLSFIKKEICNAIACQPDVICHLADELQCVGLIVPDVQQAVKFVDGKNPYQKADTMIGPAIELVQKYPERKAPDLMRALNNVGLGDVTSDSDMISAVRSVPVSLTTSVSASQHLPAQGHSYGIQPHFPTSGIDCFSQPINHPVTVQGMTKIKFCGDVAKHIPSKWRLVGIALGLETDQLDAMEQQYQGNQMDCFAEVFDAWKNNTTIVPFTWVGLVQALQRNFVREKALAMNLAKSHSVCEDSLKPPVSLLKDPPTLPDFLDQVAIHIQAKHYWFGLAIGVEDSELKGYRDQYRGDQLRCFESIFKYWKSRLPDAKPFKWSSVVQALKMRIVGANALARELDSKIISA